MQTWLAMCIGQTSCIYIDKSHYTSILPTPILPKQCKKGKKQIQNMLGMMWLYSLLQPAYDCEVTAWLNRSFTWETIVNYSYFAKYLYFLRICAQIYDCCDPGIFWKWKKICNKWYKYIYQRDGWFPITPKFLNHKSRNVCIPT